MVRLQVSVSVLGAVLVAVMVALVPANRFASATVGVLSLVRLSVSLTPASEVESKSGLLS